MNVRDLIEQLEDVDPDTEVRLAMQPSWPFEYSIGQVLVPDVPDMSCCPECGIPWEFAESKGHDDGCPLDDITDPLEVDWTDVATNVVYLAEGSQLDYLPGMVKAGLGW